MKRAQHKIEIQKKVLDISRTLFLQQGYAKTTIRDIMQKANIKNSTLYHFFKNKEDIFMRLAEDVIDVIEKNVDRIPIKSKDPYQRFLLDFVPQLYIVLKYKNLADLYLAAYNSGRISRIIVERASARQQALLSKCLPDLTPEDYYVRALAIKGALHSFFQAALENDATENIKRIPDILMLLLLIYNMPMGQTMKTIKNTLAIVEKNPIKNIIEIVAKNPLRIFGFE